MTLNGVLRRLTAVLTAPVWVWVFFLAAVVSGVHSSILWILTGVLVPVEKLPNLWIYRAADRLELVIRDFVRGGRHAE